MSANFFEVQFRQAPIAQALVDDANRIITANDAFETLFSSRPRAIDGAALDSVVPAESRHLITRQSLRNEEGRRIATLVQVAPATGDELGLAEAWFASGPARLWHTDPVGIPLLPPFAGATPPIAPELHDEDALAFEASFRTAVDTETVFRATARWLRPGGGFEWMQSIAVPIRGSRGEIERWVGCTVSVDELMFELRALEADLQKAQRRLAELDGFASMLAREVSSPARALGMVASFILEDARHIELGFAQESLDLLRDRSSRLTAIVETLLAVARFEAPRDVKRVRPEHIIEEVLRILTPGRRLRVDVVEPLPELETSPSAFQQVMTNLISNAMNAGAKNVMVRGKRDADFVHFEVNDDGPGIPVAEQSQVWELFWSTRPTDESLGVGLALVRRIIERSGGSIRLESSPGKGTVFHLRLPHRLEAMD